MKLTEGLQNPTSKSPWVLGVQKYEFEKNIQNQSATKEKQTKFLMYILGIKQNFLINNVYVYIYIVSDVTGVVFLYIS